MRTINTSVLFLATASLASEVQLRGTTNNDKDLEQERELQSLNFLGPDPSTSLFLYQCEGDCDDDSDCFGSLVCYQKGFGGSGIVPGCIGIDGSSWDYCIDPNDLNPSPTGPPPTAPSPTGPPPTAPPPTGPPPTAPQPSGNRPFGSSLFSYGGSPPASVYPLGICEGDCDSDSDCAGSLVCLQRGQNAGPVPGCSGSDESQTDYCYSPDGSVPSPSPPSPTGSPPTGSGFSNFKLKLYWEEGYFWQEERFERQWCMRCRSGFCDLGEKLYIEECDDSGIQRFDFNVVNNEEILIRLHGSNKCLQRANRDIYVRSCNPGQELQRWYAKVGGFDEFRFEISQFGASNLCVTQRHHPKPDEEVELEPCTTARIGDTSFWERCFTNTCASS